MKGPLHTCFGCERPLPLQAHHLSYKRIFDERPKDLVALCRDCHGRLHKEFPKFTKLPRRKQLLAIRILFGDVPISKWKVETKPANPSLFAPKVLDNQRIRKARYISPEAARMFHQIEFTESKV